MMDTPTGTRTQALTTEAALARLRRFYDEFSGAWIDRLEELYAPGFSFHDPFHGIQGDHAALRTYFRRVLEADLADNRFIVEDTAQGADGAYLRWRWEWRRRHADALHRVPGMTHVRFDDDGRVLTHRDIFDAGEGFYEALPVLGGVLRAIKRRI